MSYEIIYLKQFVKVSETEFIPIILTGSNNCYEMTHTGKERRERNWTTFTWALKGKLIGTLKEMVDVCEADRAKHKEQYPDEYTDNRFGYYASLAIGGASTVRTTFGMFKGLFVSGCKKAMTIEELKAQGLSIEVKNGYVYSEELNKLSLIRKSVVPNTTAELIDAINELTAYYKDSNISVQVVFVNSAERVKRVQYFANRLAKQNNVAKTKVKKLITEYFVFKFDNGYYVKGTRRGFAYTFYRGNSEKRVYTEKQATKFCDKLNHVHKNEFKVEKIVLEKPIEILV